MRFIQATSMGLLLAACGGKGGNGTTGGAGAGTAAAPSLIRADGSSTVFPLSEAVAEAFHAAAPDLKVTVGVSGTGGGFKKFCVGETEISDASRPIKQVEVDLCAKNSVEYIEIPIAYDGLAVVVNPKNTWAKDITVAELKKMWAPEAQGQITKWSQIREGWPDTELKLFGPGVDSGTYDYFTEAIVGKEHSSRGDYTASEDDNVLVQGVAASEGALGFFGLTYYEENKDKLAVLAIDDGKPENGAGAITPTADTVRDTTYQPLARPLFIYIAKKALERPEVQKFVDFYLTQTPKLSKEVGFVPLPDKAFELAKDRVAKRKVGSLFGGKGSKVGVSIEQLLQSEQAATP